MLYLLLTNLLNFANAGSLNKPCDAADVDCLQSRLLDDALQIESLGRQLANSLARVKTAEELIQVYKDSATKTREALDEAGRALRPSPWYMSPVLWFSIGATVAMAITVAIVYALVPAVR